jgi:hypothetical protein
MRRLLQAYRLLESLHCSGPTLDRVAWLGVTSAVCRTRRPVVHIHVEAFDYSWLQHNCFIEYYAARG